ncbi:hypothetical protein TNCV_1219761 [Trichonephila clavipes]|nr:hypothetical protein TNCV_1219761 [Trichonephila clavipes]
MQNTNTSLIRVVAYLNSQRYIFQKLRHGAVLYFRGFGDVMFQQDSGRPCVACCVLTFSDTDGVCSCLNQHILQISVPMTIFGHGLLRDCTSTALQTFRWSNSPLTSTHTLTVIALNEQPIQSRDYNTGIPNTEFGTVIEDDDTNVDAEKELSLEENLELLVTKKNSTNQNRIQKSAISKTIRRETVLFEDERFRDARGSSLGAVRHLSGGSDHEDLWGAEEMTSSRCRVQQSRCGKIPVVEGEEAL